MKIGLAFITHAAGAELLRRSVWALRSQSLQGCWEVAVGVDAVTDDDVELVRDVLRPQALPFPCTVVGVLRHPARAALAHRNTARNAAVRATSAEIVWPLDGDVVLEPHAVEHALKTIAKSGAACVSPLHSAPQGIGSATWMRDYADAVRAFSSTKPARGPRWMSGAPASVNYPTAYEGFPTMPRAVFDAIGGFDERFVGYGGNKYELVCRLAALDRRGLLRMRLITSIRCLHQPHGSDHMVRTEENRLLATKLSDMRRGAAWWLSEVNAVARLAASAFWSVRPAGPPA